MPNFEFHVPALSNFVPDETTAADAVVTGHDVTGIRVRSVEKISDKPVTYSVVVEADDHDRMREFVREWHTGLLTATEMDGVLAEIAD